MMIGRLTTRTLVIVTLAVTLLAAAAAFAAGGVLNQHSSDADVPQIVTDRPAEESAAATDTPVGTTPDASTETTEAMDEDSDYHENDTDKADHTSYTNDDMTAPTEDPAGHDEMMDEVPDYSDDVSEEHEVVQPPVRDDDYMDEPDDHDEMMDDESDHSGDVGESSVYEDSMDTGDYMDREGH